MAIIRPFKALRPVRDKAHLIAALPHYSYKRNVLRAILDVNPYIFLNIIHPEFKSKIKTAPKSIERFQQIAEKYKEFQESGHLIKDKNDCLYLYRQTKGEHSTIGIIGGASVQDYKKDKIKKHEATLRSKEMLFTNYLDVVGYNAEPVLLSYTGEGKIKAFIDKKIKERPEYEFTTTDLVKHELWVFLPKETPAIIEAFDEIDVTYICDGHHRSASSAGLRELRNQRNEQHFPNEDYFMAYFVEESSLRILEFNRLVRTLNGLHPGEFLSALKDNFDVKSVGRSIRPKNRHEITMCLENKWYVLSCKPHIIDENHPVKRLDAEILTNYVLDPILGIEDLTSDENIDFISGDRPIRELSNKIRKGTYSIGFVLYPLGIEDIKLVADNNMIMPPKSTWVEPKLRSGLTIYHLNE